MRPTSKRNIRLIAVRIVRRYKAGVPMSTCEWLLVEEIESAISQARQQPEPQRRHRRRA